MNYEGFVRKVAETRNVEVTDELRKEIAGFFGKFVGATLPVWILITRLCTYAVPKLLGGVFLVSFFVYMFFVSTMFMLLAEDTSAYNKCRKICKMWPVSIILMIVGLLALKLLVLV